MLKFNTSVPITAVYEGTRLSQTGKTERIGEEFNVDLKAFGIIPFSTVNVEVVDELYVAVLGTPFGMKLYTGGIVQGMSGAPILKDGKLIGAVTHV